MDTPEQMWDRFVEHLNKVDPLGKPAKDKKGKPIPVPTHKMFLGSIEKYKKVFVEANGAPAPFLDPNT